MAQCSKDCSLKSPRAAGPPGLLHMEHEGRCYFRIQARPTHWGKLEFSPPVCLPADEPSELLARIRPGCSHSNKRDLMHPAWVGQVAILLKRTSSHLRQAIKGKNINICICTYPHMPVFWYLTKPLILCSLWNCALHSDDFQWLEPSAVAIRVYFFFLFPICAQRVSHSINPFMLT